MLKSLGWEVAMRGSWVAVAVAVALAAVLAGCGPTASRPMAQATGTAAATRASRTAAMTLATQMLSQLVVPAGSQAADPSPLPPQLGVPSAGNPSPYTVQVHRFVLVREPSAAVQSFLLAHVPTGMSWFGKGLAPGTTNTVTVLWVAYSPRSVASGLTNAELGTAALPLADGDTLIRVDASVSWFPPRSVAEQLNAARFRSITVTGTDFNPPQRTVTHTFTSPAVIGRLVALVDSLPATPDTDAFYGSCSGSPPIVYQLSFIPGVVINLDGCGGSDPVKVNGKEQPSLWDQGVVNTAVRQLLHLPT